MPFKDKLADTAITVADRLSQQDSPKNVVTDSGKDLLNYLISRNSGSIGSRQLPVLGLNAASNPNLSQLINLISQLKLQGQASIPLQPGWDMGIQSQGLIPTEVSLNKYGPKSDFNVSVGRNPEQGWNARFQMRIPLKD